MKRFLILLIFMFTCPLLAQIGDIPGEGEPTIERCLERCDRTLALQQDSAEATFNITINGCVAGNITTCLGCLALTALPAVIACWVACGIIVPSGCAHIIDNAWNRYVNELVLAGDRWAQCIEQCELDCT